ncbi:hypothetical protein CH380_17975 [Leptospira adleri]|uniref:Uncharacterized protein n=1 Tax=Leptospira adleri TaxID=2023186 RepID=A0A2M9YJV5_9LEPT|nr:hypothetical protein CH380_17975 [Leptospira adleri]PJZ62275.1 hypothetical protein CH376_08670 [Leptospira adleri]
MPILRNQTDRLIRIFSKIVSIFIIFLCTISFSNCQSKNLKLQGDLVRLNELPFYGAGFSVSASKVDKEDLEGLRKDLKNELSSRAPKDRLERWKEISELNGSEGIYILFQIVPETRVLPEFLVFQFLLNEQPSERIWPYYLQTITAKVRNARFSALPAYGAVGYPYYAVPPGVYPSGALLYDSDVTTDTEHIYRFLVRFPKNSFYRDSDRKNFFQVTTPAKSILKFEY